MTTIAHRVRPPAVAGSFYERDPRALAADVGQHLRAAPVVRGAPGHVEAIIVPHAGYVYSAPIAARAFRILADPSVAARIRRVVVLGPAHTVACDGMALPTTDAFATPLGTVPVDIELRDRVRGLPGVALDDGPHAREHSLEVQLPFLQSLLQDFTVLPIVVGRARAADVARLIDAVRGDDTLVVVSTDLSHYEPYESARKHDRDTCASVVACDGAAIGALDACGVHPLRGLLAAADRHGWTVRELAVANSGDTAGPRDRVVGYGAFVVTSPDHPASDSLDPRDADVLLDVAEHALRRALTPAVARRDPIAVPARLRAPGAAFVTLHHGAELLGCIGSIAATRPLVDDVAAHALDAAFRDPRFPPLQPTDLQGLTISVSVLTEPEPLAVHSYVDLIDALVPGTDGVLLDSGHHHATLLPAVWADLPDPEAFLAALWRKAGLPLGAWPPGTTIRTYRAQECHRTIRPIPPCAA